MTQTSYILGVGCALPERVLTNADLEAMVDTSNDWILARTGIMERRIAAPGQVTSDLAREAALVALEDAGLEVDDLTHIVVATCTPDAYCPSTASILSHKLGAHGAMVMDMNAACAGFIYSLEVARSFVCANPQAKILLVAAEVLTSRVNWADRTTCVLFGDGAGAAIIAGEPSSNTPGRIGDIELASNGAHWELLTMKGGGSSAPYGLGDPVRDDFFITMEGREIFRHAVRNMESICRTVLKEEDMTVEDLGLVITHQANLRIIEALANRLCVPKEKLFVNVHKYGNTSAASVPIALAEARQQSRFGAGDSVLLATFGGGLTWAGCVLHF